MNINSILPLLAAVAYIPLLLIVAAAHRLQKKNSLFIIFLIAGMIWSLSSFLLRSDFLVDYKLYIFKAVVCSLLWLVVQFFYFVRFNVFRSAGWGTYLGYAGLAIVTLGAALGFVPQSLIVEPGGRVIPTLGLWILPIVLIPIGMAVTLLISLARKFTRSSDPIERNRLIYLFISIFLLAIFGGINTTKIGDAFPVAQIGQLANAAILTYATLRYRIVDMNLVVRRGFVYSAMVGIYLAIFSFWLVLFNFVLDGQLNFLASFAAAALSGLATASFWIPLTNFLYKKVDKLFLGESYNYRQKLTDFVRKGITRIFTLEDLSKELLPILIKVLDSKRVFLLLPDSTSNNYEAKFVEPKIDLPIPFLIKGDGPIARWLKQENKFLSTSQFEFIPEFQGLWKKEKDDINTLDIEMLFPLISRDNLVGILAVSHKQTGKFNLNEINLIEDISAQIAIHVEKEHVQAELRRSEQELSLINRLAGVMTSSLNIQDIYDVFIKGLGEVVDIDFAAVTLLEENDMVITAIHSNVGAKWQVGEKVPVKGTPLEWLNRNKRSLYEPNLSADSVFSTGEDLLLRGIRSIVYLPLIAKNETIGGLTLASTQVNAYLPAQLSLLDRLVSQISTSVANAQLFARAEQRSRIDELTGLFNRRHFDESLRLEISRHSRYGNIFSVALLDLDNFKIYNDRMGHPAGDKLLIMIGSLMKACIRNTDLPYRYGGDEFAIIMPNTKPEDALAVAERLRLRVSNQTKSDKFMITSSIGIASWPTDGIGQDDILDAADKALYYSKQTGGNRTCLVSQMLPTTTSESLDLFPTSEKETLNTIYALAATIEARDPYTYGHSRKVRTYAVSLAESIGLPSEKVAIISHAALLHDIGKIGVGDDILKKKQSLTPKEQKAIRYHPQLSKTIVAHVASLTACLPSILHHHERWDGKGYPYGLKAEAIPLEARVLTIADSFDAMTSLRPYRQPLSYKDAINELRKNAGKQFDPELVEKFIPIALATRADEIEIVDEVLETIDNTVVE